MKKAKSDIIFDTINGILIMLLCLVFIIPFWMVIISSFTDNISLTIHGYSLWPQKWSLEGYKYIFNAESLNLVRAIGNSLFVSITSTLISVALSTTAAYVLSKKDLVGHRFFNVIYVITMFFSGGMIPFFLVLRSIHLYDTIWALVLPYALNVYHIILVRSYFYSLPSSLNEAARIDGATELQVLVKIMLPMSVPMVLTIAFFMFVDRWNSWIDALLFLSPSSEHLVPMQFVLQKMLNDMDSIGGSASGGLTPTQTAQSCGVVIAIFPLLVMLPILQKYFIIGITVGAVKG